MCVCILSLSPRCKLSGGGTQQDRVGFRICSFHPENVTDAAEGKPSRAGTGSSKVSPPACKPQKLKKKKKVVRKTPLNNARPEIGSTRRRRKRTWVEIALSSSLLLCVWGEGFLVNSLHRLLLQTERHSESDPVSFITFATFGLLSHMLKLIYFLQIKAYTQLKISGLYPSAYWCGQALVDIPLYYVVLLLMTGILFAVHQEIHFFPEEFLAVVFCLVGYIPSVILFHYVVSFTFKTVQNTKEFWSFVFSAVALICIIVMDVAFTEWFAIAVILHTCFCVFIPIYPLIGCLNTLLEVTQKLSQKIERKAEILLVSALVPYLQCVIWIFLLRYLEVKWGGKLMRKDPFFRTPTKVKCWKFPDGSYDEDEDEDEDVVAERLRVKEMASCESCEERPAILISRLHKVYDEKTDFLLGRKIKKVATNHVSLCVKKGEILGILGPNGAGKSTLINILVGEVEPTSGQALMGDNSFSENNRNNSVRFMGYCPQTNPLWPHITMQEHFEIYGAIKGMGSSDIIEVIKCISGALDLKEDLQKTVKKLGAGSKRKLCFALSMLGNPHVTLLDEPSAGMDPVAIQQMWKAIRAAFKSQERAAILTTHYMAEAEAVCDRVGILVSGKLRCIGTVQHLKTKFGRGYFLEMKLKQVPDILQRERLERKILRIFPNANCQKSFDSILAYRIPKEDVQSLALSFSKLEEAKHAFNIEEYNFSQATLEQVFMELVKEQEEDDCNFGTLNGTISWERSQGERVIF